MPRPASTSPTCPAQILKVGVEHWLTPERGAPSWSLPATWCCSETRANRNARLPGYATLAVHTSFDVTKRVQLYAIVNNVLDRHFAAHVPVGWPKGALLIACRHGRRRLVCAAGGGSLRRSRAGRLGGRPHIDEPATG